MPYIILTSLQSVISKEQSSWAFEKKIKAKALSEAEETDVEHHPKFVIGLLFILHITI